MRLRIFHLWFVLLALAFSASSQALNAGGSREPDPLQMDGFWRFHTGDDPAWADPDFDDSQWPLAAPEVSWTVPRPAPSTITGWYRLHVMLPEGAEPLSLFVPPLPTSYQLFANGREFGQFGSPSILTRSPIPQLFRIPTDTSRSRAVVLSVRVQYQPHLAWYAGAPGFHGLPMVGPASRTFERFYFDGLAAIHNKISSFFVVFLCLQLTMLSTYFYLLRRSDRLYLWVAIYALASAVFFGLIASMPLFSWPIVPTGLLFGGLNFVFAISEFQIVANLLTAEPVAGPDRRTRRNYPWILAFVAAVLIGAIDEMLVVDGGRSGLWNDIHSILFLAIPASIFWLIRTSTSSSASSDRLRAWIVFAVLTCVLAYFNVLGLVGKLPFVSRTLKDSLAASFRSLLVAPFPVGFWEVSETLILTALFVITLDRFSRKMRDAKRSQSEIKAAEMVRV